MKKNCNPDFLNSKQVHRLVTEKEGKIADFWTLSQSRRDGIWAYMLSRQAIGPTAEFGGQSLGR